MKNGMKILVGLIALMCIGFVVADTPSGQVSQSVNLQITLLNQDPDPVQPGRYVELRFRIENLGAYKTGDTVFELVPEYPFSFYPGDTASRELGTLYGRSIGTEAATLYYKLSVDKNAVSGDNFVRLRYSVDGGNTWVLTDKINIRVESVYAIVGIDDVSTVPEKIEPGKTAKVTVVLKNYADAGMEDVTLKLDMSGTTMPFVPYDSISERKVRYLAAGESKEFIFDILALGDADSQIYKLPIVISYVDSANRFYNKSDIMALVVGAEPDIVTVVDEQEVYSGGQAGTVTFKFVNKGVTDLKFLNVEVVESDDFELYSADSVYIGDLDSDDYETAEFSIYVKPTKDDKVLIPMKLEYTDPNNEHFSEEFAVQVNLYSKGELKKYGLASNGTFTNIIILLIIAGVGYWFYRRRKKVKK